MHAKRRQLRATRSGSNDTEMSLDYIGRPSREAKLLILRSQLVKFLTYLSLSRQQVRYLPTKYQRDKSSGFEWLAMGASV